MSNYTTEIPTKTTSKSNGNGQVVAFGASIREAVKSEHFNSPDNDVTVGANETESSAIKVKPFPVLDGKCFHGLSGEIVRTIEPHTEADSAALLIQLLSGFGNLIGRSAYFSINDSDFHYLKINAVLVGATARGRKGTSWNEIERLLVRADESFQKCIQNGLSSGEGLIYHVRDQRIEKRPVKKHGLIVEYQDEIVDFGAEEKRAFVIEPEFARVLKVITREGNTLSSVIRDAWDKDRFQVMTKNAVSASNAHITITGHITQTELIRNLEETETANGFANRFLWFLVKRSKYLPDGGKLPANDLNRIVTKLSSVAALARHTKEIRRGDEANEKWRREYQRLSDGFGGLLGSVTSRATAQVMRLACVYALLDNKDEISLDHLDAALAVWQYAEDSAKYIFGESLGDKVSTQIYEALKEAAAPLTRTEISELFNRNLKAREIDAGLQTLLELDRIEIFNEKTDGRPRQKIRVKF